MSCSVALDSWEEALQKDTLLARALLGQNVTTLDRMRECRQLQLKHQVRLGVILVKMGYADRGIVEKAIRGVVDQLGGRPASTAGGYQAAQTQLDGPGGPVQYLDDQPTILDGHAGPGAQMATLLNNPYDAPLRPPGHDPFASVSTKQSVEELNPFLQRGGQKSAGRASSDLDIPLPEQLRPVPSADELNAFADVPLPPPPSPGAHEMFEESAAPVDDEEPAEPQFRSSGFTAAGVPIGGEIETGSTRLKAREKADLKRKKNHKRAKRKSRSRKALWRIVRSPPPEQTRA